MRKRSSFCSRVPNSLLNPHDLFYTKMCGCRSWLSFVVVVRGCRTWLSYVVAVRGCRTWLLYVVAVYGTHRMQVLYWNPRLHQQIQQVYNGGRKPFWMFKKYNDHTICNRINFPAVRESIQFVKAWRGAKSELMASFGGSDEKIPRIHVKWAEREKSVKNPAAAPPFFIHHTTSWSTSSGYTWWVLG